MNQGLRLLNPKDQGLEEVEEAIRRQPRIKYTRMRAHRELATQALAVGATQKLAAQYAGVSRRQVAKYMTEADFRERIEEHRTVMASKIRGKIMKEVDRRTDGKMVRNLEVMDLMRILDRLNGNSQKGITMNFEGDVNVNKYEGVLAAIFGTDTSGDVEDFPSYEHPSLTIPGTSTSVDSPVQDSERGTADREV